MDGMPPTVELQAVRSALLGWYDAGHRAFPWRDTRDPYAILVSEVMLQQTQASRVADRFVRFLGRFPTAATLGAATEAEVLTEWNGLGYNRRALALRRTAIAVTEAGWPTDVRMLEALPGIGPYTARAIASLAFGRAVGVVDTNVRRWLLRRFRPADQPRVLQSLADALAVARSDGRAAAWTHASMEFGAAVCRARTPRCDACPVAPGCPSRGAAAVIPVARQAPLRASDRAYRGAVVRFLASAGGAMPSEDLRAAIAGDAARVGPELDDVAWRRVLDALERDGLAHRTAAVIRLGPATIGA